jgi:hypothetical protein
VGCVRHRSGSLTRTSLTTGSTCSARCIGCSRSSTTACATTSCTASTPCPTKTSSLCCRNSGQTAPSPSSSGFVFLFFLLLFLSLPCSSRTLCHCAAKQPSVFGVDERAGPRTWHVSWSVIPTLFLWLAPRRAKSLTCPFCSQKVRSVDPFSDQNHVAVASLSALCGTAAPAYVCLWWQRRSRLFYVVCLKGEKAKQRATDLLQTCEMALVNASKYPHTTPSAARLRSSHFTSCSLVFVFAPHTKRVRFRSQYVQCV